MPTHRIDREADLRALIGAPKPGPDTKEMPALDKHCRHFIALSPILFIGSTGPDGKGDVSPRGDPPGFVTVLDDRTLLIPDRPGNRRLDTMRNLIEHPNVGLIFLVPGVLETLRVNGRASLTEHPALLAAMAVRGKAPKVAIRVDIDDVFFHCGKALKRARLWDPAAQIERTDFPSMGQLIHDHREHDTPVEKIDAVIAETYETELY